MDNTEKLLYLTGVAADYLDYSGQHQPIPRADRERALRACGLSVDDPQAVAEQVFELDARPWLSWLRPLYIVDEGFADAEAEAGVFFSCHPDALQTTLSWQLECENGTRLSGKLVPAEQPETGDYVIDGVRFSRRRLPLPALVLGYHELTLSNADERRESARVVVCPSRSFNPLSPDERQWGVSCQLYTLRSERNWGVGDFGDLRELIRLAAAAGADYIGLNPLHAPCNFRAHAISPYSPSDRRFLNPLYIQLDAEPDYDCRAVELLLEQPALQRQLQQLRADDWIDYEAVSRVKYQCLEAMYTHFCSGELLQGSARAEAFTEFVRAEGEALQQFVEYESEHNDCAPVYGREPRFHQYLQWLADLQLRQCQAEAQDLGMAIGLLGDLAVGSVGQGCEASANPDLYRAGATIGAPPDPLGPLGQDWGLPVLNPLALKQSGYRHFVDLLRANMHNYGALRVDHAMALLRLWWCFQEDQHGPRTGVYVYYPLRDLLALMRLESVRNRCLVIAEDLGIVPPDFTAARAASGLFSNNLLYFDQHHDQYITPPEHQQRDALLMVTNHDVPTLCDWWNESDLQRRFDLGLVASEQELDLQRQARRGEKQKLLDWLAAAELLPAQRQRTDLDAGFDYNLCAAIHQCSARGSSQLLLLQLEDLQLMQEPVNIPGTFQEYPNWRRKQSRTTGDVFALPEAQHILQLVSEERNRDHNQNC